MKIRINANSLKNAMGTVFLLATAFFVCSTFISMRSVFADPVTPRNSIVSQSGRTSPRNQAVTSNRTVSRTSVARPTGAAVNNSATVSSRGVGTRKVSSRSITPTRANTASTRNVRSRGQNSTTSVRSNRAVRARTSASPARVSTTGSVMAGSRASTSTTYSYLTSRLYTGNYSTIVDSSTGLIAADAYSSCMESYYTCMDEICMARSDTKGRCSCAGRATNFLAAEEALEKSNEELIVLSGQLSLLIATKGEGDDLASAFSLTDAEKVMNCVSWKEMTSQYGTNYSTTEVKDWCSSHGMYTSADCKEPDYCKSSGNNFGFDISNIDGSSSDILAQLKAWADAKDLSKQYVADDADNLVNRFTNISGIVSGLAGVTTYVDADKASLDTLANKWGYKLFEYAHNNVCGRVLDSCFNGIYEGCGNPGTVTDSDGKVHSKCANGATSNCPFNYNSYISVVTDGTGTGDVKLNERGSSDATILSSSSCFGYTDTVVTSTGSRTVSTSTSDPYATLRGPVADARRSIMQKYLLDANAACDVYGNSLKTVAQNINYQKIAAEQALQQKRLEFRQEKENRIFADASAAITNFNECISEIWDCYETYEDEENWTTARIKAYCAQVSQVPHCYEPMICSPLQGQLVAVVDKNDSASCAFSNNYEDNNCRNVVTISEILYGTGVDDTAKTTAKNALAGWNGVGELRVNSAAVRENCLLSSLSCAIEPNVDNIEGGYCIRSWEKAKVYSIKYIDMDNGTEITTVSPNSYSTSDVVSDYTLSLSSTPTKDGKTFRGWCTDTAGQHCSFAITLSKGTRGNKVFYATWANQ